MCTCTLFTDRLQRLHTFCPSALFMSEVQRIQELYPQLSISLHTDAEAQWATITGTISTIVPLPGRPVANPRMLIRFPFCQTNNKYTFEVNFIDLHCGEIGDAGFHQWLKTLLPNSGYYLCPGVMNTDTGSNVKSLRRWGFPFNRVDHKNCELWIPMPKVSGKWRHLPTCTNCVKLASYLNFEERRKASITPTRKRKRQSPSSNYPISLLSPTSVTKRLKIARKRKFKTSRKLQENSFDVNVRDTTHNELITLVSRIQHQSLNELQKLLQEADRKGQGEHLRSIWKQDVEDRVAFQKDQRKNRMYMYMYCI